MELGLTQIRETNARNRINFSWLLKMRWAQLVGQSLTILACYYVLPLELPLLPLALLVIAGIVSNLAGGWWLKGQIEVSELPLVAVMLLDTVLLTGLLYWTGGAGNPFSGLYIVQISLAAVVLKPRALLFIAFVAFSSFGALFIDWRELDIPGTRRDELMRVGNWVALGVASGFVAYFLKRVTAALEQREQQLSDARNLAARQEKLGSLSTMAAGAAHELATPLGTIAIVAKELSKGLAGDTSDDVAADIQLILDEVARCRVILDQMAGGAGESAGEPAQVVPLGEILSQSMEGIRLAPKVKLQMTTAQATCMVRVPPTALAQALRALITNAQDASKPTDDVTVQTDVDDDSIVVTIEDAGHGMSKKQLSRAGEPFYTTKSPGSGMGLGLFLTRTIIESIGGALELESAPDQGTTAKVTMPKDTIISSPR